MKKHIGVMIGVFLIVCTHGIPKEEAVSEIKEVIENSSLFLSIPDSVCINTPLKIEENILLLECKETFQKDSADTIFYFQEIENDTTKVQDTAEVTIIQYLTIQVSFKLQKDSLFFEIPKKTKAELVQYARFVYDEGWKLDKISHGELLSDTSSLRITWVKSGGTEIYSPFYFISPDSLPYFEKQIKLKTEMDTLSGVSFLMDKNILYPFNPEGKEKDEWKIERESKESCIGFQVIRKESFLTEGFPWDTNIWFILKK